jgi:hypothetical protein
VSCHCGCVTSDELDELRQRFTRLLEAVGLSEESCGGPLKACIEHMPIVRHDCRKCETHRPPCRHDCQRCQGLGTVLVPKTAGRP